MSQRWAVYCEQCSVEPRRSDLHERLEFTLETSSLNSTNDLHNLLSLSSLTLAAVFARLREAEGNVKMLNAVFIDVGQCFKKS